MRAAVHKADPLRQRAGRRRRSLRHEHLRCASTHQHAGRVVHRQAHRLTVCVYHVALVNHHAHAHGQPLGPWLGGKSVLTINPRTDGSRG